MPSSSDFPTPKLSVFAAKYFALRFGAPDDDQTADGIADRINRERYRVRIAFERRNIRIRHDYLVQIFGSPDGQAENLHPSACEIAKAFILDEDAARNDVYREAIRYPAVVRGKGFTELLSPFAAGDDDPRMPISSIVDITMPDDWPRRFIGAEEAAVSRDTFTAMNPYRLRFLATLHGSPDETSDRVPEDRREAFADHVEYHNQSMHVWFDEVCARWGATDGFIESVEPARQPDALLALEHAAAGFANACRYELEISQIEARAETAQPKRKITTADLLAADEG